MTTVRSPRAEAARNERGSAEDRRRRRAWLVATYRADVDVMPVWGDGYVRVARGTGEPACRCFRCGDLLTVATVTVDRIVPGCQGGTYRRTNIRPACSKCNTDLGQPHALAARMKKGRK
ncbi:HNH endonuclease signature motif containing protein [Nocardioides nanhaiensis]|uniref:HNH nuclease domain-containing protein n=1 Tax=Nocardioides nanhaiensis TaxID=1476871 RepID=A0ABP8W4K5_9ACTN